MKARRRQWPLSWTEVMLTALSRSWLALSAPADASDVLLDLEVYDPALGEQLAQLRLSLDREDGELVAGAAAGPQIDRQVGGALQPPSAWR